MVYLLKMILILFLIHTAVQHVQADTDISAFEANNDEYSSIVSMALFEKINWMIWEMKNISLQFENLNKRFNQQERLRRLNIHVFKTGVREILQQENIKTEKLLLQLQQELLKKLDVQENLLRNNSMSLENLKLFDVNSFKRNRNWQTILRRQDGSQNFNRSWQDYKAGFGQANGEFFIGLEQLHAITTYGDPQELLVILQDFNNQTRYARYNDFLIGSESEGYKIKKIGQHHGDADDSFSQHLYCKFSTYDQDNDNTTTSNCAQMYQGGWWFSSCFNSHLTGVYLREPKINKKKTSGLIWYSWHGLEYSLKYAEMKIRPK